LADVPESRMKIHTGDVASTLRRMRPNTFHGCLTDPPYGLSFMGKQWDKGVPSAETWAEVLRVLKPGSFLLAFGGTRTYHRLTCAIEDAGFEIRDCLMWLYGSGFPKSHDISKGIDKSGGSGTQEHRSAG
jgi:DNA modification methylase